MSVFSGLVGQRAVADVLQRALAGDGMTHAWLFTGPPGSGRSVAARAFAAGLQCASQGCGECDQCRQVMGGSHPDVDVVNTEKLSIGVDDAREVVHRAATKSTTGGWQIIIVEDADRLGERAANVWLKAIEEPGPQTVFLLCAPSPEDVPVTIRSRCRTLTLRLPTSSDVAELLVAEGVEQAMAHWAARASMGHVGVARALVRDEGARAERVEVLRLPTQLGSVGESFGAAADLVAAADQEADRRSASRAAVETAAFREVLGKSRGSAGILSDLEKDQALRQKRARRDSLDRALVDLAGLYRDVLSVQLRSGAELVHGDQRALVDRLAATSSPESTLRRIEAILDCRTALEDGAKELIAVEAMALSLHAG
jgi:DNA polymerase-3 subunit delta'